MPRSSPRKQAPVNYNEDKPILDERHENIASKLGKGLEKGRSPNVAGQKRKAPPPSFEQQPSGLDSGYGTQEVPKPALKKRKSTVGGKAGGQPPLAPRTEIKSLKHSMYIGAHVSAAGGVQNAISNAIRIGANSFALFLKSQRKWDNPALAPEAKEGFLSGCKEHGYSAGDHALPHGSYLVNLAQVDDTKGDQAYRSFLDDLQRCEQLGIKLYNFHPGNTLGEKRAEGIARIAKRLNAAHKETKSVVAVLENMAGGGNVIGSTWEDLRDVIALVDDKERVGVCIDTCHAFAAGYDLRTPEAYKKTMTQFEDIVGKKYLKAFHCKFSITQKLSVRSYY